MLFVSRELLQRRMLCGALLPGVVLSGWGELLQWSMLRRALLPGQLLCGRRSVLRAVVLLERDVLLSDHGDVLSRRHGVLRVGMLRSRSMLQRSMLRSRPGLLRWEHLLRPDPVLRQQCLLRRAL